MAESAGWGKRMKVAQSFLKLLNLFLVCTCGFTITPSLKSYDQSPQQAAPTPTSSVDSTVVSAELIPPTSSHHTIHVGEQAISYVATWSAAVLKDASGIPQATISSTSYVRDDVGDHSQRPVMFAFNGGPGASSSPLHFGILGPRRLGLPDSKGSSTPIDNPQTLLDVADLVLIDPVGTGFSRELRAGGGRAYWNPEGDSKATQGVIRDWLRDNHRTASPVYIVGESFGGFRLAEMAKDLGDLNIAGLILISPATDMSGEAGINSDQHFVFTLPSMATAAYAQQQNTEQHGRSVQQVYEDARTFAQGDYVTALQQGEELGTEDRNRLAKRMALLIQLPESTIAAANLRINTQDFLEQLVPGKVVGRIDTRVAGPKLEKPLVAGRDKAADDPALHMGASNLIKNSRARDYLRNEIGVNTSLDYVSLTLDVNFAWDWDSGLHKIEDNLRSLNPTPNLAKLMKEKPAARLLLLSGYYDLATPVLYQRYNLTHSAVPLERTRMVAFAAGHAIYEGDSREAVSNELHNFIAGANKPSR
jgi:carboxypeptidase C (cathepsin A)